MLCVCVCVFLCARTHTYSLEAKMRIVWLSVSCCHTSWTLPQSDTQTNKHTKWPRTVCLCACVLVTTWWCSCVCVCAPVFICRLETNTTSKMSFIQCGWCQQSHHLTTQKPKHTHTYTVVQSINSITSQASNKLLILRWLTLSVFEVLPIEDFFTCRDLSLCLRVMLCPIFHLLPH